MVAQELVSYQGWLDDLSKLTRRSGIDMLATYVKEHFDEALAMAAWTSLDFDPTVRGQFYQGPLPNWLDQAGKS